MDLTLHILIVLNGLKDLVMVSVMTDNLGLLDWSDSEYFDSSKLHIQLYWIDYRFGQDHDVTVVAVVTVIIIIVLFVVITDVEQVLLGRYSSQRQLRSGF